MDETMILVNENEYKELKQKIDIMWQHHLWMMADIRSGLDISYSTMSDKWKEDQVLKMYNWRY